MTFCIIRMNVVYVRSIGCCLHCIIRMILIAFRSRLGTDNNIATRFWQTRTCIYDEFNAADKRKTYYNKNLTKFIRTLRASEMLNLYYALLSDKI